MGIRIGIGSLKIGQGSTGVDWSSYWATRNPTDLIVTGMRDTEIDFSWTDNSAGDCSFKVYKSTNGVTYTADGTTVAGDTTYTATGLTAGVVYYFYVVGVKSANESDATDIYDTRFKITVDTTKAGSANDTFVLPTTGAGYNAYVDWGDGGEEQNITGTPGNVSHQYATSGNYQVKIRGTFPRIYFADTGDKAKLITIDNWGNIKWSSMNRAFRSCSNMSGTYIDVPNTSAATSGEYMFDGCAKFNSPVGFDTANMTLMYAMFNGCVLFNQSLSTFNTAKNTNFLNFLNGCAKFNQPLSHFDTSKVTSFQAMLYACSLFDQDISNFNLTAPATTLTNMLYKVPLSVANYDALLIAWAAQSVPDSMNLDASWCLYTEGGDAEAARTHLVTATGSGGHGWTITDGGKAFDNGKLVITFDDARTSQYTNAYPELLSRSLKATIFVVEDQVGGTGRMSWANLQTVNANGIELQCHTKTHPDLRTLSEAQIDAELTSVNTAFTTNGIASPTVIAYPGGLNDANVRTYVADWRAAGRATTSGYVTRATDKFQLPIMYFDYGANNATVQNAKDGIDYAILHGKALIFLFHEIGIEGDFVTVAEFEEILDYAIASGIDIINMAELVALMT